MKGRLIALAAALAMLAVVPATIAGGSGTSTLTTDAALSPGNYTIVITGTSGALTHSTTVTLVVNAPGDFTITATPWQSVLRGGAAIYSVTVAPVGGFNADVSLSVTGLPNGSSATFNPATVAGGTGASTMTVKTAKGTKIGTYTLTITGTGGGKSYATTVTLSVN